MLMWARGQFGQSDRFPNSDHMGLQWQQNNWMLKTAKCVVLSHKRQEYRVERQGSVRYKLLVNCYRPSHMFTYSSFLHPRHCGTSRHLKEFTLE